MGTADAARIPQEDQAAFWILNEAYPRKNAHLEFALREAAEAVRTFRSEGKRVLLQCVRMESRTPTVAAIYGSLTSDLTPAEALARVKEELPEAQPNAAFMGLLRRLGG